MYTFSELLPPLMHVPTVCVLVKNVVLLWVRCIVDMLFPFCFWMRVCAYTAYVKLVH